MRALQLVKYGEIKDSLAFNEVKKPTVQKQDVLIEVKAAAINPIDKGIILGNLQALLPIQAGCLDYQFTIRLEFRRSPNG